MRASDANKCPSFLLKAANDVAAIGQHEVPPPNHMTEGQVRLAVLSERYTRSTKLSTTFFSPAFSNAMVSLLPSIFTTLP